MPVAVSQVIEAERFNNPHEVLKSLEQALGKTVKLEINGFEWDEWPEWNNPVTRQDSIVLEGVLGQRHGNGVIITHLVGYDPVNKTDVAYVPNADDEYISEIVEGGNVLWINPFNNFFCHQGIRPEGMSLEEYRRMDPFKAESTVRVSPKYEAVRAGKYNRFLGIAVIRDFHVRYLETPEVTKLLPRPQAISSPQPPIYEE